MKIEAMGGVLAGFAAMGGLLRGNQKKRVPTEHLGFKLRRGRVVRYRLRVWKWGQYKVFRPGLRVVCVPLLHELTCIDLRLQVTINEDPVAVMMADGSTFNFTVGMEWTVRPEEAYQVKFKIENADALIGKKLKGSIQKHGSFAHLDTFSFEKIEGEMRKELERLLWPFGIKVHCVNILERNPTAATRWAHSRTEWISRSAQGIQAAVREWGYEKLSDVPPQLLAALADTPVFAAQAEAEASLSGESGRSDSADEAVGRDFHLIKNQ